MNMKSVISRNAHAARVVGNNQDLETLKRRLIREKTDATDPSLWLSLQQAADEAASLAWTTAYPVLVLPELFAEKAADACRRWQRQLDIHQQSLGLVAQTT
jgi:hypothetical protein